MANGDTKTESYLRVAAEGTRADLPSDTCCNTKTQNLILGVANRIMDVEDEVEELKNNPDVVDIVDTYQDLQNYDTSTLTDKDIIRVLEDSTHSDSSTYYRWNATTNQFDYIGEAGGGGSTVVQTTGTSTTDVMSQNAVTDMIYANTASLTNGGIRIGPGSSIGSNATRSIAIGAYSSAAGGSTYSVALGANAITTRVGEVNVGTGASTTGYGGTSYRVLGGVHDPVDAHDAATKGYVDNQSGRFFNIADIVYDAYLDPEVQKTITLQEYTALQEACMDYLPLAYCRLEVDVYEFVLLPHYDCLPSTSINVYGEMGSFHFEYNGGQPYVEFYPA